MPAKVPYHKPVFSEFDYEHGHWKHGYPPDVFLRIAAGYACGHCGEDYLGQYRERCPVCGFVTRTEAERVGDQPEAWRGR